MIKTVNLNENVTAVEVTGKQNVTVKNIGNNTAYVSVNPDISVGGDDCLSVKAGEIVTLEGVATLKKVGGQFGVHGTVYAFSSNATTIELISTNSVNFKPAAVDYSGDIADISSLIPTAASAGNQLTDKAYVDSGLNSKVDKADGMGLSSNDYTTAEKNKLSALTNYDDSTVNSAIADLQTGKADKSETYTKSETDTKITEKVAEIVADAPEDFDTLKEMSDWIANHETSAAAMNSAIQTNASNISSLQAGKVDKETGKSLVSDSEISRLATLENYDDTAVKSDIADIQSVIPAAASPDNQLADKAYVSAMQSGSPYIYMTQAEYEALTEYEPDRMYWVTYPLSKCHLVWCNGECVSNEGLQPYGTEKDYRQYAAIVYNPDGVTPSGSSSKTTRFSDNLQKIDIANGVTSIGSNAFYGCSGLTDIIIPNGVISIGSNAFYNCSNLINIKVPDNFVSISSGIFSGCTKLFNQTGVQYADKWVIGFNSTETTANIKEGTTLIYHNSFRSNTSLTDVIIPDSILSIEYGAFDGCTKLANIDIPEGVINIGSRAFYSCRNINVSIPDSVRTIGEYAFINCSRIIKPILIPEGVTEIKKDTFNGCSGIPSVTISDTVKTIGEYAFSNCTGINSVNIGSGTTSIGLVAFSSCKALKTVTIGSGITTIDSSAFQNCTQSDLTITINKPQGSISGSPWGATNATIVWTG